MNKPSLYILSLLTLALIILTLLKTQGVSYELTEKIETRHEITKVAASSYVRKGQHRPIFKSEDIANIGFIIGSSCVAVIDTGASYNEGLRLLETIRELTATPICYVINTHAHPDHMLGNKAFKAADVTFIGHHKLAQSLALVGDFFLQRLRASEYATAQDTEIIFPDKAVSGTLELDLGDRKLQLTAHATAHTTADLSIYDPKDDVLWLGDLLFLEHVPALDGSLLGWIAELEDLQDKQMTTVIPGHGAVNKAWPQAGHGLLRYLRVLRDETREWIAAGGDIEGAQEHVGLSERGLWQQFDDFHKRNVISAYAELEWE